MSKRNVCCNQRGASLLTILFMISILSIFIGMGLTQNDTDRQNRTTQRLVAGKAKLRRFVQKYTLSPTSLRNSMNYPSNTVLKHCITGKGGCPMGTARSFTLYGPLQNGVPIAGSPGKPVQYNLNAEPCGNQPSCRFALESQFIALCPGSTAAVPTGGCSNPDRILVLINLKSVSTSGSSGMISKTMDQIEVPVSDIMEIAEQLPPASALATTGNGMNPPAIGLNNKLNPTIAAQTRGDY